MAERHSQKCTPVSGTDDRRGAPEYLTGDVDMINARASIHRDGTRLRGQAQVVGYTDARPVTWNSADDLRGLET
jgi:hypothetical protein